MCEEIEKLYDEVENMKQRRVFVYMASPLTDQKRGKAIANDKARKIIFDFLNKSKKAFFETYDPAIITSPGSNHSSREVYLIDYKKVFSSDLIIFHVSSPSIGVGIEAQLADSIGIPSIIIHPKSTTVSRMLLGIPTNRLATIQYESIRDLTSKLKEIIPDVTRQVVERIPQRRRCIEEISSAEIGRRIISYRIRKQLPLADFSRKSLLSSDFIKLIELYDECAVGISAFQLRCVAEALNCRCYPIANGLLRFSDSTDLLPLRAIERESLDSFIDFIKTRKTIVENRVFKLWDNYMEMRQCAIVGREELDEPLSKEDWKKLYDSEDSLF